MCHGECLLDASNSIKDGFTVKKLEYALRKLVSFLIKNKNEIITIFFENYINDTKSLQDVFGKVKHLNNLVFNPYSKEWNVKLNGWPKIKDMIEKNKRLLIIDDEQRGKHAKAYPGFIRSRDYVSFYNFNYIWPI